MTVEDTIKDLIIELSFRPAENDMQYHVVRVKAAISNFGHFVTYIIDMDHPLYAATEVDIEMLKKTLGYLDKLPETKEDFLVMLAICFILGEKAANSFYKECKRYAPELLKMNILDI